eukprot:gene5144-10283_t
MSSFSSSINDLPLVLANTLNESCKTSQFPRLLSHILGACRLIGDTMRDGGLSSDHVGSTNAFGDSQLEVDIKTDAIVFDALRESGAVYIAASEESPAEIECGGSGEGFSVGFDPLDGSSIIAANFAVGSIIGVWKGNGLLNRKGNEQCCSLIAQYGPRVTIMLALNNELTLSGEKHCMELTMNRDKWIVSKDHVTIAPKAKTFAPGNLRATADNLAYKTLVSYWIENKYTLRYSGGLVPDVYHILIKGEGVLANASSPKAKAKLRLLFECAPIALIIEAAGGMSCVCASEAAETVQPISILDVTITDLDKRIGVCYGSSEE